MAASVDCASLMVCNNATGSKVALCSVSFSLASVLTASRRITAPFFCSTQA